MKTKKLDISIAVINKEHHTIMRRASQIKISEPMLKTQKKETKKKTDNLHLPQSFCQTPLSELPGIHQSLFRQVDVLHVRRIGGRCTADARGDEDGVGLEDDTVVDELVNGEGD